MRLILFFTVAVLFLASPAWAGEPAKAPLASSPYQQLAETIAGGGGPWTAWQITSDMEIPEAKCQKCEPITGDIAARLEVLEELEKQLEAIESQISDLDGKLREIKRKVYRDLLESFHQRYSYEQPYYSAIHFYEFPKNLIKE